MVNRVESKATPGVAALLTTVLSNPKALQQVVSDAFDAGVAAGVELEVICVLNDPRLSPPLLQGCRVVTAGLNLGYAGGLQLARSLTKADRLWILQDDVSFDSALLSELIAAYMLNPDAGVVAPVLESELGVGQFEVRGGLVTEAGEFVTDFPLVMTSSEVANELPRLNWLSLAGALLPAKAWDQVGGPDPEFFPLQNVDVDLGFRLSRAGYRMAVSPSAVIKHEFGGSSAGVMKRFLNQDAARRFAAKHSPDLQTWPGVEKVIAPADLNERVARSATLSFLDFARFANNEVKLLSAELAQLKGTSDHSESGDDLAVANRQLELRTELEAIRNSMSWRITKPLRWLWSKLSKAGL